MALLPILSFSYVNGNGVFPQARTSDKRNSGRIIDCMLSLILEIKENASRFKRFWAIPESCKRVDHIGGHLDTLKRASVPSHSWSIQWSIFRGAPLFLVVQTEEGTGLWVSVRRVVTLRMDKYENIFLLRWLQQQFRCSSLRWWNSTSDWKSPAKIPRVGDTSRNNRPTEEWQTWICNWGWNENKEQ